MEILGKRSQWVACNAETAEPPQKIEPVTMMFEDADLKASPGPVTCWTDSCVPHALLQVPVLCAGE